jgi:hypothetical protein
MESRPGLTLNQRNNYISIRQKPDQDAGWGTLRQPKRFELPFLTPHQVKSHLGFEAVPSSEFWQFSTTGKIRLQVNRISADRYANSVGLALLDGNNKRVAPLVQSASGRGEPIEIPPGTYKVVASLGIAANLKDLVFEFLAAPIGARLKATLLTRFPASGHLGGSLLAGSHRGLHGQGVTHWLAASGSLHAFRGRHLRGTGRTVAAATAHLAAGGSRRSLAGQARMALSGGMRLSVARLKSLRAQAFSAGTGQARIATVRWLDEPMNPWRARRVGDVAELNRPYVRFEVTAAAQAELLRSLQHLLSA